MAHRAVFTVIVGPNEGDTVSVEAGFCRLVGRHLSDNETALIDRDGNRILDGSTAEIITTHLKEKSPPLGSTANPGTFTAETFERGPDIILADDSISRAHAMFFCDGTSVGVIDLASTNGTFVNNERISSHAVTDGDQISLGNSEIVVRTQS